MLQLHMEEGFTVGLEMSGARNALEEMIEVNAPCGGHIALLGILPTKTMIDGTKVVFKSLLLKGIYGREMFETWHKAICLLQEGLATSPPSSPTNSPPKSLKKALK